MGPFVGGLALVLGALGALYATDASRLAVVEGENAAIEAELTAIQDLVGASSMEDVFAALDQRRALIEELTGSRGQVAHLLAAASTAVPTGGWLVRLEVAADRLHMEGRGFDPVVAADVMDGLRNTGCFEEIQLVSMEQPRSGGPHQFVIDAGASTCGSVRPNPRAFTPPHDPSRGPAPGSRPPLLRWEADLYRVVSVEPGVSAEVRDPDGRTHTITVGTMLGAPAARVTFITDATVLLSLDEVTDRETGALRSRVIELPVE